MAKTNVKTSSPPLKTHEGASAKRISSLQALRRSVMSAMLWEATFYEDGQSIADRVKELVPNVTPTDVASLAVEARTKGNLRHMPLLLLRELIRHPKVKDYPGLVRDTFYNVIQRADEPAEFLSLYWGDGKKILPRQVRLGLGHALTKFSEYELAKNDHASAKVRLRDVLFYTHARPLTREEDRGTVIPALQKKGYSRGEVLRHEDHLYSKIAKGELMTPDTWEVGLSTGQDKKETWTRLLKEGKLGHLALLRNLRNMAEADVDEKLIRNAILVGKGSERTLPFRYIAAARAAPQFQNVLDIAMQQRLENDIKLPGKTIILVDHSGSMDSPLSGKSDLKQFDAACGIAAVARALSDSARVFSFTTQTVEVPAKHGMALIDAIRDSQTWGGTYLGEAIKRVIQEPYDRLIVVTDEQSHDTVNQPKAKYNYLINVAPYRNGVGYGGKWVHIDGFSESVVKFIQQYESEA